MRQFSVFCALSIAVAMGATPLAHGQAAAPAQGHVVNGAFAGAGECIWTANRGESALATAFIGEVVTQAVKGFASAIVNSAKGRTETASASLVSDLASHQCVQFVRGSIDMTRTQDEIARDLAGWGLGGGDDAARRLYNNGLRLAGPPALLVEARLYTVRRAADQTRLVRLDPSFIAYRDPSFTQILRFWDGRQRTFAMQIQVAEAPAAPADNATGAQVQLGRHNPGASVRLLPQGNDEPSPRAGYAFQLKPNTLYNARVSVSESSSPSAFLAFWGNVMSAQGVQTALANEVNLVVNEGARDTARTNASTAYNTARTALVTLVEGCPAAGAANWDSWVRTNRENLYRAITAHNNAAQETTPARANAARLAPAAGVSDIQAWCVTAKTHFLTQ